MPRIAAIDAVKAAAIVAVALTHSGVGPWDPGYSGWDFWVCGVLVNFQVPAFLFVSGFLYRRALPVSARETWRRFIRVVVPYLVASAVAYALGIARFRDLRDLAFQLATGSALGIYYFVFLLALFVPTIWLLSRMTARALWWLCGALWTMAIGTELYAYARIVDTARPPTLAGFFWLARSPFNFNYALFVSGWLAAAHRDGLATLATRYRAACVLGCLGAGALFVGVAARWPWAIVGTLRMAYTLGVVGLIALLTPARPVPRVVGFLSAASLGLYLYHAMFQMALRPLVHAWPGPARIAAVAGAGLLGAGLLCRLGTALLGRRARMVLGA